MTEAITATHAGQDRACAPAKPSPAVSVVVPCFNGGRFLEGLMASLGQQTFRDFEIVIVDDGSRDTATLEKLAVLDGAVRVIHQENAGPSAARNAGIRAAQADILFMLDCDDTIEPDYLADTVPLLMASPPDVGMVFTDIRLAGAESGISTRYFNRFDLLFTNTLSSGLLLRRGAWRAAGGYDEGMRDGYEDWDFSLRLVREGYRGLRVPRPLYVYHIAHAAAPSRSTVIDRQWLYGRLWRYIREHHAAYYTLSGMLHVWRRSRDGSGRVPLWKGLAACVAAQVLPEPLFNLLIASLHRGPRADRPGRSADRSPRKPAAKPLTQF